MVRTNVPSACTARILLPCGLRGVASPCVGVVSPPVSCDFFSEQTVATAHALCENNCFSIEKKKMINNRRFHRALEYPSTISVVDRTHFWAQYNYLGVYVYIYYAVFVDNYVIFYCAEIAMFRHRYIIHYLPPSHVIIINIYWLARF